MDAFKDKVVIITGSSDGIGRGTAVEFAKRKAKVCITGRNAINLEETATLCQQTGLAEDNILQVLGDITDDKVAEDIVRKTVWKFGGIDILVNNAGQVIKGTVETITMEDHDSLMDTNLRSVVHLTKLAIPHLVERKGNIINISSILAHRPTANLVTYCMSKAALGMFTKSLALDLGPRGVRVNAVCPGLIATRIFLKDGMSSEEDVDEFQSRWAGESPLKRVGKVDDVTESILFLASERASFITGHELYVDGGKQCSPSV